MSAGNSEGANPQLGVGPWGEEEADDGHPLPSEAHKGATSAVQRPAPAAPEEAVRYSLRVAAGYAWRLIVIGAAVYLVFVALGRLTFVAVAVFVALVIAGLLRPVVNLAARVTPRRMAVFVTLLLTILALGGVATFVARSVAGQYQTLGAQFAHGLNDIESSLAGPPLHLQVGDLSRLGDQARAWVAHNSGSLAGQAIGGAGIAAEFLTGLVLAVFCSVFFLTSGEQIWSWLLAQLGGDRRRWDIAARAGWATFAGYTRGIVVIAATNAAIVCVVLLVLRVPLALPLAVLVFFAAFIPLIGSPLALAVATLVALAARGPLIALLVLVLIVLIGQFEGHVLHPVVMSRAVNLHPLVVALSVASGTVLAGIVGAVVAVPLVAVAWTVWLVLRPEPGPA